MLVSTGPYPRTCVLILVLSSSKRHWRRGTAGYAGQLKGKCGSGVFDCGDETWNCASDAVRCLHRTPAFLVYPFLLARFTTSWVPNGHSSWVHADTVSILRLF